MKTPGTVVAGAGVCQVACTAVEEDQMTAEEVGPYLGVTRQRVEAIHRGGTQGFPRPIEAAPGTRRSWDRTEIEEWAKASWWGTRPWRSR